MATLEKRALKKTSTKDVFEQILKVFQRKFHEEPYKTLNRQALRSKKNTTELDLDVRKLQVKYNNIKQLWRKIIKDTTTATAAAQKHQDSRIEDHGNRATGNVLPNNVPDWFLIVNPVLLLANSGNDETNKGCQISSSYNSSGNGGGGGGGRIPKHTSSSSTFNNNNTNSSPLLSDSRDPTRQSFVGDFNDDEVNIMKGSSTTSLSMVYRHSDKTTTRNRCSSRDSFAGDTNDGIYIKEYQQISLTKTSSAKVQNKHSDHTTTFINNYDFSTNSFEDDELILKIEEQSPPQQPWEMVSSSPVPIQEEEEDKEDNNEREEIVIIHQTTEDDDNDDEVVLPELENHNGIVDDGGSEHLSPRTQTSASYTKNLSATKKYYKRDQNMMKAQTSSLTAETTGATTLNENEEMTADSNSIISNSSMAKYPKNSDISSGSAGSSTANTLKRAQTAPPHHRGEVKKRRRLGNNSVHRSSRGCSQHQNRIMSQLTTAVNRLADVTEERSRNEDRHRQALLDFRRDEAERNRQHEKDMAQLYFSMLRTHRQPPPVPSYEL